MNMYREVRDSLGLTRDQASELLETIKQVNWNASRVKNNSQAQTM